MIMEMVFMYKIKAYAGQKFVGYLTQPKSKEPALFRDYEEANMVAEKVNKESSFGVRFELQKVC